CVKGDHVAKVVSAAFDVFDFW
nr:immunoglobulin heavy chain junction region [Macaca mulatta]